MEAQQKVAEIKADLAAAVKKAEDDFHQLIAAIDWYRQVASCLCLWLQQIDENHLRPSSLRRPSQP
jgi:hypothetical protein